jgi:alanine racemase
MAISRSEITIDRHALRSNVRRLKEGLGRTQLWAVVKANGYGHGAETVAATALAEGASALCVATIGEGMRLRQAFPDPRILVLSPCSPSEYPLAREGRLDLVAADGPLPEGIPLHLKIDTGMGRWGVGVGEAIVSHRDVVGLMSHLASADIDPEFTELQIARFATVASEYPELICHIANSAALLRFPSARFDAVRPGIALYGLSPFGTDPMEDGLRPVLSWRSRVVQVKQLAPGESTGYQRRYIAADPTWIGIVPVGYADGFCRGLSGSEVLVGGMRRRVLGTISMDSFAVGLDRPVSVGTVVTLIGDGLLAEEHARLLNTITHEIVCGLNPSPTRTRRAVLG